MVDHPGEYQWASYGVNAQGNNVRIICSLIRVSNNSFVIQGMITLQKLKNFGNH